MRECTEPMTLEPAEAGGKPLRVEKGTPVIIPVMAIHYDPKYFPDPEKFIPERFSERLQEKFSYLPFGEGPRMCLGKLISTVDLSSISTVSRGTACIYLIRYLYIISNYIICRS